VRDGLLATASRWDARVDPHIYEGFPEPIRVIAPICQQVPGFRQTVDQCPRADVIAGLPAAQEHADRSANSVRHGVQLRVQATFRAPDKTTAPPFFNPRLDAVR